MVVTKIANQMVVQITLLFYKSLNLNDLKSQTRFFLREIQVKMGLATLPTWEHHAFSRVLVYNILLPSLNT